MLKKITIYLLIFFTLYLSSGSVTEAAGLSSPRDFMSRLKVSTDANHSISFVTSVGVSAGETITVTFPVGFAMPGGIDDSDVDLADNGTDISLAGTPSGGTWGASFSGRTLTLLSGSGAIAAGHTITIEIGTNATYGTTGDKQIQNPVSNDTYQIDLIAGTTELGAIAVNIIADDQMLIDASVAGSLRFTISAETASFGSLSVAKIRYATASGGANDPPAVAAATLSVGTNAANGFVVSVKDKGNGNGSDGNGSAGLYASAAGSLIGAIAPGNVVAGTPGYAIYGGNPSSAGEFDAEAPFKSGYTGATLLGTSFKNFAAGPGATSADQTLDLFVKSAIGDYTKAGQYVDILTLICTANF